MQVQVEVFATNADVEANEADFHVMDWTRLGDWFETIDITYPDGFVEIAIREYTPD